MDYEKGDPAIIKSVTGFNRKDLALDTLGLTVEESKLLLKNVQSELAYQQVEQYIHKHNTCNQCHKELKIKGYAEIVYRTLFGKLKLSNPRLYVCSCNKEARKKSLSLLSAILPDRVSPEL